MPEPVKPVSVEDLEKYKDFIIQLRDMSDEQISMLQELIPTIKETPEEAQKGGVFHPIVVKYYEQQIHSSISFLKQTNERGFPSVAQEVLSRHILPLHKFLTGQFNRMIVASQKHLKQRK